MKLLILASNTFESDARVHRTAATLAEEGYEVNILATHREGLPEYEEVAGYKVLRMKALRTLLLGVPVPSTPAENGRVSFPTKVQRFLKKSARFVLHRFKNLAQWVYRKVVFSSWGKRLFVSLDFKRRQIRLEAYCRLVLENVRALRPDMIHANDFHCLIAAHQVWKELKIPYVYDSHELWVERNRLDIAISKKEKPWEISLEKEAIRAARFTITVCDSIADHLGNQYGIARPTVLRNVPGRCSGSADRRKGLRKHLGISPNDFLTLYLGKVTYNRGVLDILHALPHLDEDVKFVTLGYFDQRFEKEFREVVQSLRIEKRVFSYGPVAVDEVVDWIGDCDLSLTTMNRTCLSNTYALPNKLFESIQGGLPVLGPDSPEIQKLIEQYQCGLVFRDGDPRDLAKQIDQMRQSPELLREFRRNAERAAQELCWEREKERLVSAYRNEFPISPTPSLVSGDISEVGSARNRR